ncbi:HlyD family secretion protein [Rhodoblastus sp. 17X3]|uniref:HlyD family secretion protein n=1 Tax=Rhodoblastus sp. 17X3 TaxID=3047026 RepID=UPI0024B63ABB|nr:HlyD family secretion protein [Rhodoblastus sp. 17X3]MDI9848501.1 HlyD family secretion protein [Rhodoblastus sp. 17X3]
MTNTQSTEPATVDPRDEARNRRAARLKPVGLVVVLALALGGLYLWYEGRNIESTDDAYTDGRAMIISPRVSGNVVSLDATDNQFVKQGQVLLRIDPRQYQFERDLAAGALASAKAQLAAQQYGFEVAQKNFPALLAQAQAQLASAKATLAKAQADYDRQRSLSKLATSAQDVDAAKAAMEQARAQVALAEAQVAQASPVPQRVGEIEKQIGQLQGAVQQAQARLDQAELNLSWTELRAPEDGWITKRNVELGNVVSPGQQLFAIVRPERWVTANFKENQLNRMRLGQKVKIEVDAFPDLKLEGHVDSIQQGTGSKFTAFPPENATGNFVKVVQRVPVKIAIDSGLDPNAPLPLGLSVVPTVALK